MADGMGALDRGRAADGAFALLIRDQDTLAGSSVFSAPVAVEEKSAYILSGRVLLVDGADCGVYAKFYDRAGALIGTGEDQINIAPKSAASGMRGKYSPIRFEFTTPALCAELAVWIHSYNAAQVTLLLDDFELKRADR
jgi:hypothetical protein